ncbi:MAG: phospho-sugar mutase [Thermoflavifilum sp.]|nr:phospho-sugar mutase [Thermoflavifilum sp.]
MPDIVTVEQRIQQWLDGPFDEDTKQQIRKLQQENPEELREAFYKNLEFGTGGLRGIMGPGTNRMNKYTVGMATQGYANYLKQCFPMPIRVAIGHDSRNNSRFFAEITAQVMAANDIEVFLFESLRPTPELSFAIRYLKCQGGVVCTASHNPKEYNGYKAYWNDGAQLVSPHDQNVIAEVEKIRHINDVKWQGNPHLIHLIGEDIDRAYLDMVKSLSIFPEVARQQHNMKIVYTPIHGSGIKLVPQALAQLGFNSVHIVEQQAQPDGNFPTVLYPNPEEPEAMSLGLQKAKAIDADILLGTDPDADRVGVSVKNQQGEWILLNGNQTAVLAFNYVIEARREKNLLTPQDYVVKTIVTTDMIDAIAAHHHVRCYNVLTGFKYIASLIREKEGKEKYLIGGEESYGLMIGDQIRDKDAVSAVALICEMAAYEKTKGRSLFDKLIELYLQYGCYRESLLSITRKGIQGSAEIAAMMDRFRQTPPQTIAGTPVEWIFDYQLREKRNLFTGEKQPIDLPRSNVLQFLLQDGSKISARPSGTEPKIKFYFSVRQPLAHADAFRATWDALGTRIDHMIKELDLKKAE